jgi:DNA polymerase I
MHSQPESRLYGVDNNRELIQKTEGRYEINEDLLDIFDYYKGTIPEWKPTKKIKPYSELTKVYLDIETAGLDPNKDRIFLIGMRNEKKEDFILKHENEATLLTRFLRVLRRKNPDILALFNGFEFDLPFLIRRCELHNINHPFWVRPQTTVFRTAMKFNKPTTYNAVYLQNSDTAIIDLYHQVLAWDYVARKLTSHSLKQSTLQMDLRKEQRLELLYEEMLNCWENREEGGLEKLEEYLKYDLEDTELLGERLIPSIYYQKLFLDWKLQSLSTGGNGSKWNSMLETAMPESKFKLKPQTPVKFAGGLTYALAGFYRNCFKVDVESLYPSIMLTYAIYSNKDSKMLQLQILQYMKFERLRLKHLAEETGDEEANQMQGAMKVMINSAYGMLGTTGINFNDYEAAALVTGYGRVILKHMMIKVEEYGGGVIEADTDGLLITCKPGQEREIWSKTNAAMPQGIKLAFEWQAKSIFIPPSKKDPTKGLKKNYIIVFSKEEMKANGKFRKRDKCVLEKTFQPKLVKLLTFEGKSAAQFYYDDIIEQLMTRDYPLDNLIVKRKVRANEKRLCELRLGEPGESTWYYFTLDRIGGKGKHYYKPTQTGDYSIEFYVDMVTQQYKDVMKFT